MRSLDPIVAFTSMQAISLVCWHIKAELIAMPLMHEASWSILTSLSNMSLQKRNSHDDGTSSTKHDPIPSQISHDKKIHFGATLQMHNLAKTTEKDRTGPPAIQRTNYDDILQSILEQFVLLIKRLIRMGIEAPRNLDPVEDFECDHTLGNCISSFCIHMVTVDE